MKAAVVEFNYYHDEILPTVVYALNELGVEPDVYVPTRAARKDAFALAPRLRYRLKLIDGTSRIRAALARMRGTPARFGRYDVLIMNSVEPIALLESAVRIDLPTIAIVHNADNLQGDGPYARFFASASHQAIVLGRHVARSLGVESGQGWIAPFYLGEVDGIDAGGDGRKRLCVQGNVQFVRRDYGALLDAIGELAPERSDFVVQIVGRSTSSDGRDLRAQVRARGLDDRFTFSPGEISHREYLSSVATSDFILPLVGSQTLALAPYFSVKITSSMSMAIGLGVLPIAETSLAKLYLAEDAAVTHEPGALPAAIREALEMSAASHADRVRRLGRIRSDALASSVQNLAAALDRLGVAP